MTRVEAAVDIDAPIERVWAILIDFPAYGEWNPLLTELIGRPQQGARLSVRTEPPGGRAWTWHPVVRTLDPDHELRWVGRLGVPGLLDCEHGFQLEARPGGGSRLTQHERLRGLLLPFARRWLRSVAVGVGQMNDALKARAEAPA